MRMLTSASGTAHRMLGVCCVFAQSLAPSRNGPCWPGGGRFVVVPVNPRPPTTAASPAGIWKRGGLMSTTMRLVGVLARLENARRCASFTAWGVSCGRTGAWKKRRTCRPGPAPSYATSKRSGPPCCAGGRIEIFAPKSRSASARSPPTRGAGRTWRPPDRGSSRWRAAASYGRPGRRTKLGTVARELDGGRIDADADEHRPAGGAPLLNTTLCQPLSGLAALPASSMICPVNLPCAVGMKLPSATG